jgi:NNP family nitrate/nitrite transporter-like MFS transporter
MFGVLVDIFHFNSVIWMLVFGVTGVSLVWMWWTERKPMATGLRTAEVME